MKNNLRKHWIMYVMILPVLVYYIIFSYTPIYGLLLAFKDYKIKLGILGSPWVGFKYFEKFFNSYYFEMLIRNTLELSVYGFLVGFPLPIIFALMLNYLKSKYLRKTVQMVSYAPYFISTVVICGMISIFCDANTGIFNTLRNLVGLESVDFLSKAEWFKDIYVWTGVWQGLGWSSIIYISALAGVDYQLHEAAIIDGATKIQRMWHVDLPSIKPTIIMLLILNLGGLMSVGFEKSYLLQNALNQKESEIIATYVYKVGLVDHDYGFSTAVGLFNTIINLILLITANTVVKKVTDESLF
ncbi:MAG: sugar ABC transporter permease [Roseburia sp.]|nr:sugar ABC transporter permease [Roseburia sp.]